MPQNKKTFWQYNWPAFAWALFVLFLCGLPGDKIPEVTFLEWLKPDKIVHLVLFGMQCFLFLRGFSRQKKFPVLNKNAVALSLILSISYGCIVEILQTYVFIHRSGDVRDAAANALGALLGVWIYKRKFSRIETERIG
jgi:glycopeptide antibiotics resistance protein